MHRGGIRWIESLRCGTLRQMTAPLPDRPSVDELTDAFGLAAVAPESLSRFGRVYRGHHRRCRCGGEANRGLPWVGASDDYKANNLVYVDGRPTPPRWI